MNVLLLSTSDFEGGAARAAYRLHQGLHSINVDTQMLVQVKSSDDETVIGPRPNLRRDFAKIRPALESILLKFYPQHQPTSFSTQWLPDFVFPKIQKLKPDILNLHWISDGFLQIETLAKLRQPVVWTLHDMWAFTGGCHYSQTCEAYLDACGCCPQLGSQKEADLSRWNWQRKQKVWRRTNLTIVTPSHWLAKCAKSSSLLKDKRIEVIPNGVDLTIYQPHDRTIARHLLKLPLDRFIVLSGALNLQGDPRKGFELLQIALKQLAQTDWHDRLTLVTFGTSAQVNEQTLGISHRALGRLQDDLTLSLAYAAADVFVAPSLQDNLPNTVLEAIACGTPCVAFKIGGMPDLIAHEHNGFLANPFEPNHLAAGIIWVLEQAERWQKLAEAARKKAEQEFSLELQANRYKKLFQTLID